MKKKIIKNKVTDFEAGFRAGLVFSGREAKSVNKLFYSTIEWPNAMREFLQKYEEIDDAEKAIKKMEKFVEKYEFV